VTYLRGALSAIAAIFAVLLGAGLITSLREISSERRTGLGAVAGGLTESLLSPIFWLLAAAFFALFFVAGRIVNRPLRILLFWIPALVITTVGFSLIFLFAYAWLHFKRG